RASRERRARARARRVRAGAAAGASRVSRDEHANREGPRVRRDGDTPAARAPSMTRYGLPCPGITLSLYEALEPPVLAMLTEIDWPGLSTPSGKNMRKYGSPAGSPDDLPPASATPVVCSGAVTLTPCASAVTTTSKCVSITEVPLFVMTH